MRKNTTLEYILATLSLKKNSHVEERSTWDIIGLSVDTFFGFGMLTILGGLVTSLFLDIIWGLEYESTIGWCMVSTAFLLLIGILGTRMTVKTTKSNKDPKTLETSIAEILGIREHMDQSERVILHGARVTRCKEDVHYGVPVLVVEMEHLGSTHTGIASVADIRFNHKDNQSYICDVSMHRGYIY